MVFLSFFISSVIVTVHAAPSFWSIETVDLSGENGGYTSLALDASGYPHISYYDDINDDLKFAWWTGSDWSIDTVDSGGNVGSWTSLALDASDYPHISYYYFIDATHGALKYAQWTGADWSLEIVDSGENVGHWASLALDSSDHPHISYYDDSNDDLKYARWTGSFWEIETIDSGGNVGSWTSLALDASDHPHISYHDDSNDDLKYARWTGTQWSIDLIDSDGYVGDSTSLALDASDHPHISYHDDSNDDLKYTRWTGTQWSTEIVDSVDGACWWTSLALDASDHPHISYYYVIDPTHGTLKYALWTGTQWSIETVDSDEGAGGEVGRFTSLALDSTDHPHISYHDGTTDDLKYARAPDEYFSSIIPIPFDGNGDSFDDAVEVAIDADTTHFGPLDVWVDAYLWDPDGSSVAFNVSSWSITGTGQEYPSVSLYVPQGATPGRYDVELYLRDGDFNLEDYVYVSDAVYLYPPTASFESCTASGVPQDSFELDDAIYVRATDFAPSTSFPIYVVVDTTWTNGMAIPSRVAGTATSITSNTGGVIEATPVWSSPLTLGTYDVVVDVNGNSMYDEGVDALDDSDIEVTAGVEVIPEFTVAMLIPVLAGISVLAVVVKKRLLLR
ncbi:MAG: hypothetical protein ACXADB_06420 [Candidatus Hermodarchaeia archaeon]